MVDQVKTKTTRKPKVKPKEFLCIVSCHGETNSAKFFAKDDIDAELKARLWAVENLSFSANKLVVAVQEVE